MAFTHSSYVCFSSVPANLVSSRTQSIFRSNSWVSPASHQKPIQTNLKSRELMSSNITSQGIQARPNIPIIARGETWIAVDKPSGMLVHRTKLYHAMPGEVYLVDELVSILEAQYGISTKVYPVQRLDRPTSGVMVFGLHTSDNAAKLQAALQDTMSRKHYWALASGADMPSSWTNDNPLKDMVGKYRKRRPACTYFEQLCRLDISDMSVVRARITTGRRHQIRRHLSNSRHPIVGDTTHGIGRLNRAAREQLQVERCCLHSRRLRFNDPSTSEEICLESSVPTDLQSVLRKLPEWGALQEGNLDLG